MYSYTVYVRLDECNKHGYFALVGSISYSTRHKDSLVECDKAAFHIKNLISVTCMHPRVKFTGRYLDIMICLFRNHEISLKTFIFHQFLNEIRKGFELYFIHALRLAILIRTKHVHFKNDLLKSSDSNKLYFSLHRIAGSISQTRKCFAEFLKVFPLLMHRHHFVTRILLQTGSSKFLCNSEDTGLKEAILSSCEKSESFEAREDEGLIIFCKTQNAILPITCLISKNDPWSTELHRSLTQESALRKTVFFTKSPSFSQGIY